MIVIGNWKMHKTEEEAVSFIHSLLEKVGGCKAGFTNLSQSADELRQSQIEADRGLNEEGMAKAMPDEEDRSGKAIAGSTPAEFVKPAYKVGVFLSVPFTLIKPCVEAAGGEITIGAQNMHDAREGAFTGEIAAVMLKDQGASFVLLGHSERRSYFGETNAFIQKKVARALSEKLTPVLCVGENREERDLGKTEEVLETQIRECLLGIDEIDGLMLAYEPVWAIGQASSATPEVAEEAHTFCRSVLQDLFGKKSAKSVPLLYGGSVNPDNAKDLTAKPNVQGLLVGGASLTVDTFSQIIKNIG